VRALAADLLGEALTALEPPRRGNRLEPGGGERPHRRRADPARRSGDQGDARAGFLVVRQSSYAGSSR